MQRSETVDRARALWDGGRRRDAIVELRTRVRKEPGDAVARLLLASWYREVRAPDQAGRWGIALPGWTTARERELLARLIASSGVRDEHLGRFLALPAGERPAELDEVMAIVDGLRAPDGWRGAKPLRPCDLRSRIAHAVHVLGWLLLAGALLTSGLVALTGDDATSPRAAASRWGSSCSPWPRSWRARGPAVAGGGSLRRRCCSPWP
ncbi:hypothetical protein [Clavibacter michiganensis]|uniref:hypothetical protein n=1 Tax=Clavibacter michiganensis TaxID=28447 RepID=UPI001FB35B7F|nr:hypothetical protein [Clavibacter michiganensis]